MIKMWYAISVQNNEFVTYFSGAGRLLTSFVLHCAYEILKGFVCSLWNQFAFLNIIKSVDLLLLCPTGLHAEG